MERLIQIQIEKLPEGVYLATSDDIQGLVAQGRTVNGSEPLQQIPNSFVSAAVCCDIVRV